MKNTKKILVVFTGGTIGSTAADGIINVNNNAKYDLLNRFKKVWIGERVVFDTIEPLKMLSENAGPQDWEVLIQSISNTGYSDYSGIIVTHGTDTLPYTAAALSFGLLGITRPVVIVSSNRPLAAEQSNGLTNFLHAVSFILQTEFTGVYVVYQNPDSICHLHLGTRLTEAVPYLHYYRSSKYSELGSFNTGGKLQYNNSKLIPAPEELNIPSINTYNLLPSFSSDILYIRPYPGLNYNLYSFTEIRPKAILHDLYHSGTACTNTEFALYSILNFAERCKNKSIDLYIAPVPEAAELYVTADSMHKSSIISLTDISVEAAIVKLMLVYGNFSDSQVIRKIMKSSNLFHEIIRENSGSS